MRFSTIAVAAFAGAAIAAPAGKLGTHQIDNKIEKRMGPWAAAGLGSVAGWFGAKMGIFRRDLSSIRSKPQEEWTFAELSELLADDAANYLSLRANANEATICVDIPYTVENDDLARETGSFNVEAEGKNSTYDCFILGGPNTFKIDLEQGAPTPDSVSVIPGPGKWNQSTGVLTL